jgi:hypothetical protein
MDAKQTTDGAGQDVTPADPPPTTNKIRCCYKHLSTRGQQYLRYHTHGTNMLHTTDADNIGSRVSMTYCGSNHKGAHSSSWPYISCNVSSVNEYDKAADLNDRPKLFLSRSLSICSDLADDGKLGYGFTLADELEEVNIGPGDKTGPTFVSKKLDSSLQEPMIALLKEYSDCFAWDYTEMPRLDRSIIKHWLPLKKGFWPFQQ